MGNNIQLLLYLDTSTHFLWMTFSARLMKRRWTGIESYFPLHRVRKWCFRHLWVQSGIPICLLEIGNGGTARRDVVKVCALSQRPGGCRARVYLRGTVVWWRVWTWLRSLLRSFSERFTSSAKQTPSHLTDWNLCWLSAQYIHSQIDGTDGRMDGWMDGTTDRYIIIA